MRGTADRFRRAGRYCRPLVFDVIGMSVPPLDRVISPALLIPEALARPDAGCAMAHPLAGRKLDQGIGPFEVPRWRRALLAGDDYACAAFVTGAGRR